ncbi:MAG: hypothetical protein OSA40_03740 [Phycisphaerales bacterium]|nr:hypothetical protein [Phycisphaerales bacterium]
MRSTPRSLRSLRSLLVISTMALAGCANPFMDNYVGGRQELEGTPVRVFKEIKSTRLGVSKFSKKMEIGQLPGDDEALATAEEVGASAYWWRYAPTFSASDESARMGAGDGMVGSTPAFGPALGEKAFKWYDFEAVFYANPPVKKP